MKTLNKVKVFAWRVSREGLPTQYDLIGKNMLMLKISVGYVKSVWKTFHMLYFIAIPFKMFGTNIFLLC